MKSNNPQSKLSSVTRTDIIASLVAEMDSESIASDEFTIAQFIEMSGKSESASKWFLSKQVAMKLLSVRKAGGKNVYRRVVK